MDGMTKEEKIDIIANLYRERNRYIDIACSFLHDRDAAKDVVSDCYIALLEDPQRYSFDAQGIKGFMYQSVKNRCLDELKHLSVKEIVYHNLHEAELRYVSDDSTTRRIIRNDINSCLDEAKLKMKKRTFDIFVSSRVSGLSNKELSLLYGLSKGQISKELAKASAIMATIFNKYLYALLFMYTIF